MHLKEMEGNILIQLLDKLYLIYLLFSSESGIRVITLYSNGFTVDDGEFRALTDPRNHSFIDSMNKG